MEIFKFLKSTRHYFKVCYAQPKQRGAASQMFSATTASGYVEPEDKMQNEWLMYSQMQSFMYGEGVLARSARSSLSDISPQKESA